MIHLPRDMYMDPKKYKREFKAVRVLIKDVIGLFSKVANKTVNNKNIIDFTEQVIDFEMKVVNMTKPKEYFRNSTLTYNPTKVGDFIKKYPELDLKTFLDEMFKDTNVKINDDTPMTVTVPQFFDQFNEYFKGVPIEFKGTNNYSCH